MPHNRAPKPGAPFYLPTAQYRTAVNYCLSYKDLKKDLLNLNGWHSHNDDGQPRGVGISDPTANEGIKRARIEKKIDVIEGSVRDVAGRWLYADMLRSVTDEHCTFQMLKMKGLPLNKNAFVKMRREIYWKVYHRM